MGRATAVFAGAATAQRVTRRRYIFGAFFAGLASLARLGAGPATYKIGARADRSPEDAPGSTRSLPAFWGGCDRRS